MVACSTGGGSPRLPAIPIWIFQGADNFVLADGVFAVRRITSPPKTLSPTFGFVEVIP